MWLSSSRLALALAPLLALLTLSSTAAAAPAVDGTFPLKSELGANNKIVAGPDGNLWVTLEDVTKTVAKVTPGGQVEEFGLKEVEGAQGIAPGPEGNLWVPTINKVTSFAPADPEGTAHTYTLPKIGANAQIVAGPDGLMWVASNNSLVHFDPANPEGTEQEVPVAELSPKDIDVAGSLIVIADGSGESRIATFTTSGTQQDYPIPNGPQGVAGAPSGQIAFSSQLATPEQVGLITPPGPAQASELLGDPFGVAFGPDGAFWIAQFAAGGVTRLAPTGEKTFLGGLPVESPRQIAAGPGHTLWVTLQKNEKGVVASVARISGVEAASQEGPKQAPETKIVRGPKKVVKTRRKRAAVTFRFASDTAGANFRCALTKLRKGRSPRPAFRACASPKRYRLAPGRYRFTVRAVLRGVVDPTPSRRNFRVVRVR